MSNESQSPKEIITILFNSIAQREGQVTPEALKDFIIACFEEFMNFKTNASEATVDICNKITEKAKEKTNA